MEVLDHAAFALRSAGQSAAAGRRQVIGLYLIEALGSAGGALLTVCIFFYTKERFHWDLPQNFLLAAVQGLVYVAGALLAGKLTAKVDRRVALTALYLANALVTTAGAWVYSTTAITAVLLAYTFLAALS